MKQILHASLSLFFMLSLSGCGQADLKQLDAELKNIKLNARQTVNKNGMARLQMPKPVVYQSAVMRSEVTLLDPMHPLQHFPLNTLKFIGTVMANNQLQAYILTPDNMIYSVKPGDEIGDHKAKVKEVTPNQVLIADTKSDAKAKNKEEIITLQLKE